MAGRAQDRRRRSEHRAGLQDLRRGQARPWDRRLGEGARGGLSQAPRVPDACSLANWRCEMKPRIDATDFGSITVEGTVFDHDVVISPGGRSLFRAWW